ncbi:hypothetical protein NDU88_007144 [Pleurodeles waltl]|uniref:Uncharacterized protein n=1 Tax=Pleurodeles waltl TaxID=8319 RepID=A0AAV7QJX3_PLEWA|nr:hypothetical protein NDU88_007144 [Pleurodeles waltl]
MEGLEQGPTWTKPRSHTKQGAQRPDKKVQHQEIQHSWQQRRQRPDTDTRPPKKNAPGLAAPLGKSPPVTREEQEQEAQPERDTPEVANINHTKQHRRVDPPEEWSRTPYPTPKRATDPQEKTTKRGIPSGRANK